MSINISKFNITFEKYIKKLGQPVTFLFKDGGVADGCAVVLPIWRKSKTSFEKHITQLGRSDNVYYEYIGPSSFDITGFGENDYIIFDDKKHCFVKAQRVDVGGNTQFYTGIVKRVERGDGDVFN